MSYSSRPKYLPQHVYMFTGTIAQIPAGMQLCDGTNGTVDLRDRFVVCASADDAGQAKTNITGSLLKSHDTGVMPAHTHTISGDYNTGSDTNRNLSGGTANNPYVTTNSAGTGTKVIAVFYALAFIQRIGG